MKEIENSIRKNDEEVKKYKEKISQVRKDVQELRTTAKLFQTRVCAHCERKLLLPTVHFMCMHSFHEGCLMTIDYRNRECPKCSAEHSDTLERRAQFLNQANDHEQFFKELKLDSKKKKFDTIAKYFGRGLFDESVIAQNVDNH